MIARAGRAHAYDPRNLYRNSECHALYICLLAVR